MCAKWVQKSMDFEVENREKLVKKAFKKIFLFQHEFFIDFGSILEGLGEGLGALGRLLGSLKGSQKGKIDFFNKIAIFKGFGEGLGSILGGSWEGFGSVLVGSGSLWTLLGPLSAVLGVFCNFCSVLVFF